MFNIFTVKIEIINTIINTIVFRFIYLFLFSEAHFYSSLNSRGLLQSRA